MTESRSAPNWELLRNPFQGSAELFNGATGRVSGRSADIRMIITGGQGAIIITGAPNIGKTSLARALQRSPMEGWSWRNELPGLRELVNLDHFYFLPIDLKPLEGVEQTGEVRRLFIDQCISSLRSPGLYKDVEYTGSRGLRTLLQQMFSCQSDAHCYFMLDNIELLQEPDLPQFDASRPRSQQERSLALLDSSGVIRLLVDLLDEFPQFGVILFLESQPIAEIGNIYKNVSADLARFTTMLLQVFTGEDARRFLGQAPYVLGDEWGQFFKDAGQDSLFSQSEQAWLYKQAGTHPYLLRQLCFQTFELKHQKAIMRKTWEEIDDSERDQLTALINERVSAYFDRTWKRVTRALQNSSPEAQEQFYSYMQASDQWQNQDGSVPGAWSKLDEGLRYILRSEGIVRADLSLPVEYPGELLRLYLERRAREQSGLAANRLSTGQKELHILLPGQAPVSIVLSEIEYRLVKTLLDHPQRCSEAQLMQAAWGHLIDRSVFTQRMHHLRKKLRRAANDEEIIENRYGGIYLLSHVEWLQM